MFLLFKKKFAVFFGYGCVAATLQFAKQKFVHEQRGKMFLDDAVHLSCSILLRVSLFQ